MPTKKKKPEELNTVEYIETFVERVEKCIKIIDRVMPSLKTATMHSDEIEHIRDELAQVVQIGILVKDRHGKIKDKKS